MPASALFVSMCHVGYKANEPHDFPCARHAQQSTCGAHHERRDCLSSGGAGGGAPHQRQVGLLACFDSAHGGLPVCLMLLESFRGAGRRLLGSRPLLAKALCSIISPCAPLLDGFSTSCSVLSVVFFLLGSFAQQECKFDIMCGGILSGSWRWRVEADRCGALLPHASCSAWVGALQTFTLLFVHMATLCQLPSQSPSICWVARSTTSANRVCLVRRHA